jgi:DNA-binding transcriptional ArsR family regulator
MENGLDLALHPIRMRILMTLAGREMTAQQVADALGDVPPATLYRHLNRLSGAGMLKVAAERRVRGTVEKVYALTEGMQMSPEEFEALNREDHLRYFTLFITALLDDFRRYVQKAEPLNLRADGVGYRKFPLELSDEEFTAMARKVNAVLQPYLANKPAPKRKRRIFAMVVLPDQPATVQTGRNKPAPGTSRGRGKQTRKKSRR